MRIPGLTFSRLFTVLLLWLQEFPGTTGGSVVLREESWTLLPKDCAENRKMGSFVIWNRLYVSLLMLLVDERYVVAKAIRPVCLRQLGSVPISGVKLFSSLWNFFHQKLLFYFFFLSFLPASRKSLAIFVHLAVAFLVLILLIGWDSKIELQFLFGSVVSFLCSQRNKYI